MTSNFWIDFTRTLVFDVGVVISVGVSSSWWRGSILVAGSRTVSHLHLGNFLVASLILVVVSIFFCQLCVIVIRLSDRDL